MVLPSTLNPTNIAIYQLQLDTDYPHCGCPSQRHARSKFSSGRRQCIRDDHCPDLAVLGHPGRCPDGGAEEHVAGARRSGTSWC